MKFCIQLSAYYPDASYGGKKLYDEMLAQAVLCDRLGFESVAITEHHLINILLMPAPLTFAVKIADATKHLKIMTAVAVLPLHDMRIFAGELIIADLFTNGRLLLGVGRGAFEFEMTRLGTPLSSSREKFNESLAVLQALLANEEVSWNGKYYQFDCITVQPRPNRPIPIMMACATSKSIYDSASRGFHIQTTPLSGDRAQLVELVNAFSAGREQVCNRDDIPTLSLSRVGMVTNNAADKAKKLAKAHHYYSQFDNVYTGPGLVEKGFIKPLPRKQTIQQLDSNLLVCSTSEMVDKLGLYNELGIERFILNPNYGAGQTAQLETIQQFAEDVMPHFPAEKASKEVAYS